MTWGGTNSWEETAGRSFQPAPESVIPACTKKWLCKFVTEGIFFSVLNENYGLFADGAGAYRLPGSSGPPPVKRLLGASRSLPPRSFPGRTRRKDRRARGACPREAELWWSPPPSVTERWGDASSRQFPPAGVHARPGAEPLGLLGALCVESSPAEYDREEFPRSAVGVPQGGGGFRSWISIEK